MWVGDEPKAKPRPRFARSGDAVRAFTPVSAKLSEWKIRQEFLKLEAPPLEGPLMLMVKVYLAPPKMAKKWQGVAQPTKRPDLDNYIKTVLDALNKYAWKDDSQVVRIVGEKCYSWSGSPGWGIRIDRY